MSLEDKEIHFKEVWLIDKLQLTKNKSSNTIFIFIFLRYVKVP